MAKLSTLKNIGKTIERKLKSVGINTAEELQAVGSKDAFIRLKLKYPEVCLVHLYTIHGAIENIDFNQLPETTKLELKAFSDSLKKNLIK